MQASAASEPRIWDSAEALPRDELAELQLERLRMTVARVLRAQPAGAQRLAAAGITVPEEIGRTMARISGLRGRHDDVLVVRGINIHPSQVEHVLLSEDGAAPHYRLVVERPGPLDELTLECEPAPACGDPSLLRARLERLLREHTGLRITVAMMRPGTVPRSEGKAVRVVDRRP